MQRSVLYTLAFVAAVCVVASVLVASSAVVLKDRQDANKLLNQRRNVLAVAGLTADRERLSDDEVNRRFEQSVRAVVIELSTGDTVPNADPTQFDQRQATQDPRTSRLAPDNSAGIARLPHRAIVYRVMEGTAIRSLLLPIEGQGLWSTLYGYIGLSADLQTVTGITFYEHAETPGLGGEIDNPRWKARWEGRTPFDDDWNPRLQVIKGATGPPQDAPYEVDGLSGATITGRGVSNLVRFWLGEHGFGPYLTTYRQAMGIS